MASPDRNKQEVCKSIVKLAAAGWSRRQIARETKLSRRQVLRHLRTLGIASESEKKEEVRVGDEA